MACLLLAGDDEVRPILGQGSFGLKTLDIRARLRFGDGQRYPGASGENVMNNADQC